MKGKPYLDERPDTSNDLIDESDWKNLISTVVLQTKDDYVKLQHPASRVKKNIQEVYLTSVAFIFDPSYQLKNWDWNAEDQMTVDQFIEELLDIGREGYTKYQTVCIAEARKYWEEKKLPVLDFIPESVSVSGEVFFIEQRNSDTYFINYEERYIKMDKLDPDAAKTLLTACLKIIIRKHDMANKPITPSRVAILVEELILLLTVNNFFAYAGTPQPEEIFTAKDIA